MGTQGVWRSHRCGTHPNAYPTQRQQQQPEMPTAKCDSLDQKGIPPALTTHSWNTTALTRQEIGFDKHGLLHNHGTFSSWKGFIMNLQSSWYCFCTRNLSFITSVGGKKKKKTLVLFSYVRPTTEAARRPALSWCLFTSSALSLVTFHSRASCCVHTLWETLGLQNIKYAPPRITGEDTGRGSR